MNSNIAVTALLLIFTMSFGCKKEKPTEGIYKGVFRYGSPLTKGNHQVVSYYKITESNEDYVLISLSYASDSDTLHKSGKNEIEGMLKTGNYPPPCKIKGYWSKKFLKDHYTIEGTFTQTFRKPGGPYVSSGTFEISTEE